MRLVLVQGAAVDMGATPACWVGLLLQGRGLSMGGIQRAETVARMTMFTAKMPAHLQADVETDMV